MTAQTAIPDDILAIAATCDDRWPLLPIGDRPFCVRFWVPWNGKDEYGKTIPNPVIALDFKRRLADLAAASVPFERLDVDRNLMARAWFATASERDATMDGPKASSVWCDKLQVEDGRDPREHVTLVLEYFLPDGRRHLHVWDDYGNDVEGTRYCWLDGNWSHDCNRADEIVQDGVPDHGFTLDEQGHVVHECEHTITLGWAVLRRRNRATGEVRFEPAIYPGEDGVATTI